MIIEMRIDSLKPGTVAKYEEAFARVLPERTELSRLGAFWHTEIGPLNEVIHLWPYESMEELLRVQEMEAKLGAPTDIGEFVLTQQREVFVSAPFAPSLDPLRHGTVYDIRTETLVPGGIPKFIARWSEGIGARVKLSPLVTTMYSTFGGLNKIVHIWAYKDITDREEIRAEAVRRGVWPLGTHGMGIVLKQEVKVVAPSAFSPIR